MNVRQVLGLTGMAAVVSISLPTLLSAQGGVSAISQINISDQQPQATVSLLGSGRIRVSGEFTLEVPHRAAAISGPTFEVPDVPGNDLGGRVVTDFSQGMTVELWGYVIEAESGSWTTTGGSNQRFVLRDAVISHSE
jgi:hypothetical protein